MNRTRIGLLIWKEFTQLRRDRALLPIIFVMPVLQLIMFGYVVASDINNLPTAIIDHDRTATSQRLIETFTSSSYFIVKQRPTDERQLRGLIDTGRTTVGIIIPPGLEKDMSLGKTVPVEIVVDGSDSKTASVASGYAAQIMADFSQRRLAEQGVRIRGPGIDARVRVLFNPTLRSVNAMIPGLAAMILIIGITVLMSQAVVRERERGTLEQMFVTPITRGEYLVGKITPYIVVSAIQVALVALVGILWFRVPFNGSAWVAIFGLSLFVFTAIGQGLIVSMLSRTRHQAQQATMFIMIPTMVLSGFIFPIESMPAAIVPVTYFIPLRYALVVLRSVAMKGTGFGPLVPQFLAMAGFSILVFGYAIAKFSKRLAD